MAGTGVPSNLSEGVGPKPSPELNIATVCQMGQDMVQELIRKVADVFQSLKIMSLPYGTPQSMRSAQTNSNKISESLKQIDLCFNKLRQVHKECQKKIPDDVDSSLLVPYVTARLDQGENMAEELPSQKSSKEQMLEQRKLELEAMLHAKNEQLKTLLNQMRQLVWEVNAILAWQNAV